MYEDTDDILAALSEFQYETLPSFEEDNPGVWEAIRAELDAQD